MPAHPAADGPRDFRHRDVDVLDDTVDELPRHALDSRSARGRTPARDELGHPPADAGLDGTPDGLARVIARSRARMRADAAALAGAPPADELPA